MAITVPYSLEMTKDEDAKDIVAGAVVTLVAGHLKIFIGASADPGKTQSIIGSLNNCFKKMLAHSTRIATNADSVAYGYWNAATDGTIGLAGTTAAVTDFDVAVVMSGSFTASANTHFLEESFRQLCNKLIENTKDN